MSRRPLRFVAEVTGMAPDEVEVVAAARMLRRLRVGGARRRVADRGRLTDLPTSSVHFMVIGGPAHGGPNL